MRPDETGRHTCVIPDGLRVIRGHNTNRPVLMLCCIESIGIVKGKSAAVRDLYACVQPRVTSTIVVQDIGRSSVGDIERFYNKICKRINCARGVMLLTHTRTVEQ